jgi:hypothetical protein
MGANALDQLALLVGYALTGFRHPNVTISQIGHSANDHLRVALRILEQQHFVSTIPGGGTNHMDIQGAQQLLGRVQKSGRIMVAGHGNDVTAR